MSDAMQQLAYNFQTDAFSVLTFAGVPRSLKRPAAGATGSWALPDPPKITLGLFMSHLWKIILRSTCKAR
jgi:hypothetical protein